VPSAFTSNSSVSPPEEGRKDMKYTWRPSVATSTRGQPVGGTGTARRCRRPADDPVASLFRRSCEKRSRLTDLSVSYKMYYMGRTTISIRELQQNLKGVMARVESGQTIEITRRRRPIARLAPLPAGEPVSPWPDLDERTHAVFGDRVVTPGASAIVLENRGDR
jgi:prevent-host-death family protein